MGGDLIAVWRNQKVPAILVLMSNDISNERNSKEKVERSVCEKFLELFNEKHGCNVKIERAGDPNKREPDFMCSDGVAVEVTELYANEEDGKISNKMIHGKSDPNLQNDGFGGSIMKDALKVTDEHLYIASKILEKQKKLNSGNYAGCPDGTKIYLVCNALEKCSMAGLFMGVATIRKICEELHEKMSSRKDKKHFDGIFLLLGSERKYFLESAWQPSD